MNATAPLLDISDLRVHFPRRAGTTWREDRSVVRAVDGVSLTVARGETLALVGESGCGKTTLGRAILRLVPATSGSVRFDGQEVGSLNRAQLTKLRPRMQLVFQDAGAALNPRWRIERLVAEPLEIHRQLAGATLHRKVDALLETGISLVHVRHEAACVHMADAWGRLTGEVGVALVTGGQGHTNGAAALTTALAADSPVLLLSGHAGLSELGRGAFQELAQADIARPMTKAAWTAGSVASLGPDLARAFRIARSVGGSTRGSSLTRATADSSSLRYS